jgi:hypothetical protein
VDLFGHVPEADLRAGGDEREAGGPARLLHLGRHGRPVLADLQHQGGGTGGVEVPDQGAPGGGVGTPAGTGGEQKFAAAQQVAGTGGFRDVDPAHRGIELVVADKDIHGGVAERGQRECLAHGHAAGGADGGHVRVDSLFIHSSTVPHSGPHRGVVPDVMSPGKALQPRGKDVT